MNGASTQLGTRDRADRLYDLGYTTVYSYRGDTRFAYCLYVPPEIAEHTAAPDLVVMIHGTKRTFTSYRDQLAEFGRWNHCIVLCPLFPAGVLGDGNRNGFKHLREGDIRYDRILLGMVEEVEQTYDQRFDRMGLAGYSGGGQFVNRFALLHPHRLWAASIGAPGSVTVLDTARDWWVGTRDAEQQFGSVVDIPALRRVPIQIVVGAADLETWEITHHEGGRHWMPGANDAGRTRPERAASLQQSLQAAGIDATLDVLPGIAHDGMKCLGAMSGFLGRCLADKRQREPRHH